MINTTGIKRGVTFYSFQDAYRKGDLTLEGCIRAASEMGIEGLEIIGDQMIHNSPHPDESFFEKWQGWIEKYRVPPICLDIYINSNLYKNRLLTRKEGVQALVDEIMLANRLGIPIIRMNSLTPTDIIQPALPYAEKYDVILAQEIHAGCSLDHPSMIRYTEIMQKENSPYIGLVPDMGLFCRKFPRIIRESYRSNGVQTCVADLVDEIFASGTDMRSFAHGSLEGADQVIPPVFSEMKLTPIDIEYIKYVSHFENNDISLLKEILPFIRNIHGKFYEMSEDGTEYSIPYAEIIRLLKKINYNGYICSEYEGNRFVPEGQEVQEVEQVRRHQVMIKQYIES